MKTISLKITTLAVIIGLFSCSPDKKAQLSKLKDRQTALTEKISLLETEIKAQNTDSLNTDEFKFVGLTEVQTSKFDHFIRVQGKLDGDQNAAVFAEAMGTVATKFADVGQKVVKGLELSFSVYNLFDKDYTHPAPQDYPAAGIVQDGRTVRFKMVYAF